jgi:hypothetical protein
MDLCNQPGLYRVDTRFDQNCRKIAVLFRAPARLSQ